MERQPIRPNRWRTLVGMALASALFSGVTWHLARPRIQFTWAAPSVEVMALVDGVPVGNSTIAPLTVICPPGEHQIQLTSDGYEAVEIAATCGWFQRQQVACDWKPTRQQKLIVEAEDLIRQARAESELPWPQRAARRELSGLLQDLERTPKHAGLRSRLIAALASQPAMARSILRQPGENGLLWKIGDNRLRHVGTVRHVQFIAEGKYLVSGGDDGRIAVSHANDGRRVRDFDQHRAGISALAISPNDRLVVSGDFRGEVYVWELDTGEVTRTFDVKTLVQSLDFHPDGSQFAVGCGNGDLRVFRTDSGQPLHRAKLDSRVNTVRPDASRRLRRRRFWPVHGEHMEADSSIAPI